MRINEHNLDSLRQLIRELQQENEALKSLLSDHNIPYDGTKKLVKRKEFEDYIRSCVVI